MPVDFRELQSRLIRHLQERVRNGEFTERGLARSVGISQPHLHNVLKGKHLLSIAMSDKILRYLHLDVMDLIGEEDWRQRRL